MIKNKIVICGLGNFGKEFDYTRHNVGIDFLNFFFKNNNIFWKEKSHYFYLEIEIENYSLVFLKLKSFINISGKILKKTLFDLKLNKFDLILIADNLDLEFGKFKFKNRISDNGHKGLLDIKNRFQTQNIYTLNIGISKNKPIEKWVLGKFNIQEQKFLEKNLFPKIISKAKKSLLQSHKIKGAIMEFQQSQTKSKSKKMNHLAVIGGQWGDEGKGKIVDYLTKKEYDIVARFSGGDNAGHTIVINEEKYHFSILPVSVIQPDKISVIGSSCVVNLKKLVEEIRIFKLKQNKINLKISGRCHLIMPYHIKFDELQEKNRQEDRIGTTKRGIGPCWQDRVGRFGITLNMLFDANIFAKKMEEVLEQKNSILKNIYHEKGYNSQIIISDYLTLFAEIREYVSDAFEFIHEAANSNQKILFEGAQGSLLDLNLGTYPFVTSSPTLSWQIGNCFGNVFNQTKVLGVFKAYNSRVGGGPFPTEISIINAVNQHLVENGKEFGVVTKRRRRVGWFDAVLASYSCKINGFQEIAITLLDVLSGMEEIKICTSYQVGDLLVKTPHFLFKNKKVKPQYITVPGWKENLNSIKEYKDLPKNAKNFLIQIEKLLKTPIRFISVGPERSQIIEKK